MELLSKGVALSENEIKKVLRICLIGSPFYRSLKTLEEKEIIHRIILHDASVKYALNDKLILPKAHPHFHCIECDNVTCLETDTEANTVPLPPGYEVKETQVLYEGVCPKCLKKK
jgi:Fur family ferric uptake transcriptional regulator